MKTTRRVLTMLTFVMVVFAGIEAEVDAQARVVVLPSADASVTLRSIQVSANASSLSFAAANTGSKNINSYLVTVFWFPAGGRRGFATVAQRPSNPLEMGQSHEAIMAVSDRVPLGLDTTLIVAVKTVTFDDGTSWNDENINAQVNQLARELNLP